MKTRLWLGGLVAFLVTGSLWAAENPFAGKWKMDPSKSTTVDEMKVDSAGGNKYALDLGGGFVETIAADGTDQPGVYGTMLAVTVEGADKWKVVRKKDGVVELTGNWTLSPDGGTLTDDYNEYDPKGAVTNHLLYKYQRMGGGSGFTGDWVSTSQPTDPVEVEITPWEGDGLSLTRRGVTRHVKFDGKDYAAEGANMPVGFATSGRRSGASTVELTDKIDDKVRDTQEMTVSADGKTMTVRIESSGRTRPNVLVFEKE
jgi:hypothetical protein